MLLALNSCNFLSMEEKGLEFRTKVFTSLLFNWYDKDRQQF